jgi:hypothetical protein
MWFTFYSRTVRVFASRTQNPLHDVYPENTTGQEQNIHTPIQVAFFAIEDFCSLPFSLELQQLLTRVVYLVSVEENVQHVEVFSHQHNVPFL